ncbi:MAG: RNase adapter RapZ [Elusimicrobia bacterium]|nr:RNase adapter RapZ [Elusimicrobiota bacterium]
MRIKTNSGSGSPSGSSGVGIVIVTGVSGAGKSQALKILEDFGYFCVDNLPIFLVRNFLEMLGRPYAVPMNKVAMGLDIRARSFVDELPKVLEELRASLIRYRILYLDASVEVLLRRFSETRHRHPLSTRALHDAIKTEHSQMVKTRAIADKVIDTSSLTLGELKEAISSFLGVSDQREMNLAVVSFGFKYGLPIDADLIWDVRFLPNPNYIAKLKPLSGLNTEVQQYVLKNPKAKEFMKQFVRMLTNLIPQYIKEGKSYLTLGVGCTGGRHRSVAIAHEFAADLRHAGYSVREFHRDADKGG